MLKIKKTRPSREQSRNQTRERLLASAREVFAKNGYAGASVDLIAESVGYSKGAFYSNFDSKESLFLALLEQHKKSEIEAIGSWITNANTVESIFENISAFYSNLENDVDWGLLSAEFQIQASRDPEFSKQVAGFYRDQRASLGKLIEQLFAKIGKPLPAPSGELAAVFIGLSVGLSLQRTADPSALRKGLMGDSILLVLKSLLMKL